ncbi:hypothetical protein BTVI_84201 [Pitangus sulphuratus]|nr:hypothetical protein BTVI_84201 [Pitangus sulphuratus]
MHSGVQLHGNLIKTGNSIWLKIFGMCANELSKMNCEMAILVIDLQILGPKNMKPWLHIHFNLALPQNAAEEEHPSRDPNKHPVPTPWEDWSSSPSGHTGAGVSLVESGRSCSLGSGKDRTEFTSDLSNARIVVWVSTGSVDCKAQGSGSRNKSTCFLTRLNSYSAT